jgi:16S rRNA C967 or C1407 C5-methylase (RsmB/RsmF family)
MLDAATLRLVLGPSAPAGGELDDLLAAVQQPAAQGIRLRSVDVADTLDFPLRAVPWHPRAYLVDRDHRVSQRLDYAAGQYYIQDVGSLLSVSLLDVQPGQRICDLCAAPGGKSTAVLEDLADSGWLLANEVIHARLGALQFNLARHGSPRFVVSRLDPEQLTARVGAEFDRVLVDAPCSGQSLVARGKQSGAAFQPRAIAHCAARQRRILQAAAQLVRVGGRLVYSTCTLSYAENEQQIEDFLHESSQWRAVDVPELVRWKSSIPGCYRLWPHRDQCGGAFAAVLQCVDQPPRQVDVPARRRRHPLVHRPLPDDVAAWGQLNRAHVLASDSRMFAWPESIPPVLLPLVVAGPEVTFRKRDTWFPAYGLAMLRDADWEPRLRWTLDDDQARHYVEGQVLDCPHPGWVLATWHQHPLGWCKSDGRRAKNHLPKSARITPIGRTR